VDIIAKHTNDNFLPYFEITTSLTDEKNHPIIKRGKMKRERVPRMIKPEPSVPIISVV
jgi:hypothetical protein